MLIFLLSWNEEIGAGTNETFKSQGSSIFKVISTPKPKCEPPKQLNRRGKCVNLVLG